MKIMERAVHNQLQEYLTENNVLSPQQSGFRKGHSTHTVLTYFSDYISRQMDKGRMTVAVFIDLRAFPKPVSENEALLSKLCKKSSETKL